MRIVRGNKTPGLRERRGVIAIGNFDGVHRGHQALIAKARMVSTRLRTHADVMVFEPHPREFFARDSAHFRLTPLNEKLRLFALYDVDVTIVLEFSKAFAKLGAQQFIDEVLVGRFEVAHVVVGYDFRFGEGRTGTLAALQDAGRTRGFGVSVVPAQFCDLIGTGDGSAGAGDGASGERVVFSSSRIRQHLESGDVWQAAREMGHWWRVCGTVVEGAKIGGEIGFPTANIALPAGTALAFGVYAVRVWIGRDRFDGAAYFGTRPTLDEAGSALLEVTIFHFDGDLYGRELSVEFISFVRADETFASLDDLKAQIEIDCSNVVNLLAQAGEKPVGPLQEWPNAALET